MPKKNRKANRYRSQKTFGQCPTSSAVHCIEGSVLTCSKSITAGLPSLRQLPSVDISVYEGVVCHSRGLQACMSHLLHDAGHCCHAPPAAVALQEYVEDTYVCRNALLLHVLYERPGFGEPAHRDAGIHSCSVTQYQ